MSNTHDEEILRRANERLTQRRKELGLRDSQTPPSDGFGSQHLERPCATCGTKVGIEMPTFNGKLMPVADRWVPQCADCRDREAAAQAEEDRAQRVLEADTKRTKLLAELKTPAIFASATFDSFQPHGTPEHRTRQGKVLDFLRKYVASFPRVKPLYLFRGIPGTGKGHLTHALARAVVEQHLVPVKVVKLHALVTDLRASWTKGYAGPSDEQRLSAYLTPALLVIDEVSEHAFFGQNIHQHLYSVLDTRLEALQPTILTSNEDDATLAKVLRPALMNRLEGEGGIIEFQWESWRTNRPEGGR